MNRLYHIKMHPALWAMLGVVACLALAPSVAAERGDVWITPDGTRAVDMGSPSGGNSGHGSNDGCPAPCDGGLLGDIFRGIFKSGTSAADKADQRRELDARYVTIRLQANAAWEKGDYREALRLLREQLTLRDGPNVRASIATLEKHFVDQANIELGDNYHQQAHDAKGNGDSKLALKLYKQALATYPNPSPGYRQSVADYEKYVEWETENRDERLKRKAAAAEREQRYRPEVEHLRAEAKTMIDTGPAEALEKLEAALKLLPDDPKTLGDWWLVQASLALHEARYDDAFEALQKTKGHGLDATEVAIWNNRVKEERARQGADIQKAFGDLRERLGATPGVSDPGAQLKSVERHSQNALPMHDEAMSGEAGKGFDSPGNASGNLVYPDKNNYRQIPPSLLDTHLPKEAKDDKLIQQSVAWYRQLDGQKAETTQEIAAVNDEMKMGKGDAAVLDAHLGTLKYKMKQIDNDQLNATVAVKKRLKNLSLAWVESAPPDIPKTPADHGLNSPPIEAQARPALDFIK